MQQSQGTSLKDFKILNKLGEGSFSEVYKVIRLSDQKQYAIKKVKMNMLKSKERENALNEVRLLASIDCEFIVGYKDAFIQEHCLYVVMEFCEKGDIAGQIKKQIKSGKKFPESEIWKALIQITKGLKYLHDMNILHRDLKCANIFIDINGNYKLGDMNVSKAAKKGLVYTQVGTPYYASPEIWSDKPYNNKCDIWSLACVIYEMAALKPPFRAMDMEGLYRKIRKGVFDRIPQKYSNELQNIIQGCLKVNAKQRFDVDQILNHPETQVRMQELDEISTSSSSNGNQSKKQLLGTIKCPRNLFSLNGQLPKAQYKISQEAPEPLKKIEEEEQSEIGNDNKTRKNRVYSAGIRVPLESYQQPKIVKDKQEQESKLKPIQRKNSISTEKQPVIQKHNANNLPQIPQKQTPNRRFINPSQKSENNVKPPISLDPSYKNIKSRYLLPTSKSPYNGQRRPSRLLMQEEKYQVSKNPTSNRVSENKDPLQYQNNNNKYEYLYLRNQEKDKEQKAKQLRPLSGINKQLLPPKGQISSITPQIPRKQLHPIQQNLNLPPKISQSYDLNQQLYNKLQQKEKLLIGESNYNIEKSNDQQSHRSFNRHQSAQNSIKQISFSQHNSNGLINNHPNYHKDYVIKKQQQYYQKKEQQDHYSYHNNNKKCDPYEYVYKPNRYNGNENNIIF